MRVVYLIFLFIFSFNFAIAEDTDYFKERMDFAKRKDYSPYKLYLAHIVLLDEHYKLAADPKTTIEEMNEPLLKLSEMNPIGVKVNNTIADFMEYVYQQSGSSDEAKPLLEISREKRKKAKAILDSILASGDGKSKKSAYKVINLIEEDNILEYYKLTKIGQSVTQDGPLFYDIIEVKDDEGEIHEVFFDISIFYKG